MSVLPVEWEVLWRILGSKKQKQNQAKISKFLAGACFLMNYLFLRKQAWFRDTILPVGASSTLDSGKAIDQQGSLKADAGSNTFLDKADESWRLGGLKKKVGAWKDQCVKRRKWRLKKRGLALGQGPFAFQVVGAMLAGDGSENRHRDRWLGGWGS